MTLQSAFAIRVAMRFTDRVLSLHPAIVTLLFVTLLAVDMILLFTAQDGAAFYTHLAMTAFVLIVPLMLWHYSLYRAASDRAAVEIGHSGRRGFFFVLAIVGMSAFFAGFARAAGDLDNEALWTSLPLIMLVGNLSYFASIWAASNALTRFNERAKAVEFHKTLGTFFLELYLPIGIWVIYPRIKRLLAAPLPA
jgi:hypothetical protein